MSKHAPFPGRSSQQKASSSTICQKCLLSGHYTYQCKNSRPYVSRPSRTQQLENPKLREKLKSSAEVPDEFKRQPSGLAAQILEGKEKARAKLEAENEDSEEATENVGKRKREPKEKISSSNKKRRSRSNSSSSDTSSSSSSSSSSSDSSGSR